MSGEGVTTEGKLKLQINDSGSWRNLISFSRADDLACAHVLTAGPLLAAAAGPRATLRICAEAPGRAPVVHSYWEPAKGGWRGCLP